MYTMFLSSTFNDMQKERDAFHEIILPRVNQLMQKYAESFQLCDLRWGVDTSKVSEEESAQKILKVCFDSIEHSTPFFVVMLGDRYGWVPPKNIESNVSSYGLVYHDQSVTEMEIEYERIMSSNKECRALFFFRESFPEAEMNEQNRQLYFTENDKDKKKLCQLKERILSEHPDRTFWYKADWDKENQSYSVSEFSELVVGKISEIIDDIFKNMPHLTSEERVLNESAAYYLKTAHLNMCGIDSMTAIFKDILTQIKGKVTWANELFKDELEALGKLNELEGRNQYDPYRGVILNQGEDDRHFNAGMYAMMKNKGMDMDQSFYPIPFVAGINENAQTSADLLLCIIRALELKVLALEGIKRDDDTDLTQVVKEKIDFSPWGRFPEKTIMGNRYYLEKLLNYMRKKRVVPFLLCDKYERLTDSAAKRLGFLPATGSDMAQLYMFLSMDEKCYRAMNCLKALSGHFTYQMPSPSDDEKRNLIRGLFTSENKQLPYSVENLIINRDESSNVYWVKEVCERLSELNEEDFRRVRALGDGAAAIEQVLMEKVQNASGDATDLICNRMLEYKNIVNPELLHRVLSLLSFSAHGISAELLEEVFKREGISWNTLDFELIVSRFSDYILKKEEGRYCFANEKIRKEIMRKIPHENLFTHYVDVLKTNSTGKMEFAHDCLAASGIIRDSDWLWGQIDELLSIKEIDSIRLCRLLLSVLADDGVWAADQKEMAGREHAVIWLCDVFVDYAVNEGKLSVIVPLLSLMIEKNCLPDSCKAQVLAVLSRYNDVNGNTEEGSYLFKQAFAWIEDLLKRNEALAIETVSLYAHASLWYHPEEAVQYALWIKEKVGSLTVTKENVEAVIRALYRTLLVFKNLSIEEVNQGYQEIFDLYENPEFELCYRYPGKNKRDFFYDLKLKHMGDCVEICESYAAFLARNMNRVPADAKVPCYIFSLSGGKRGNLYSTADSVVVFDTASWKDAAKSYRGKGIRLAATLYEYYRDDYWLKRWANGNYYQGDLKCRLKETAYRINDAYECYEEAHKGYGMLEKMAANEYDLAVARLYKADAAANMGELAKKFKESAYASLSEKNCQEAYELYVQTPDELMRKSQKELFLKCCLTLGSIHKGELKYYNTALNLLNRVQKKDANLFYNYYSVFFGMSKDSFVKPVDQLTNLELNNLASAASLISRHLFYGLSSQQAEERFLHHKDILLWKMEFYKGEISTAGMLYKVLCGYGCCMMRNKAAEDGKNTQFENAFVERILSKQLISERTSVILGLMRDDEIIEAIRKKGIS